VSGEAAELAALIAAADSLVERAVRRRAGERHLQARDEVRRILDAAVRLMREAPSGEVRIADVVRAAGVSNDAFYRAFRGKGELLAAVAEDRARLLVRDARVERDAAREPVEQIRACVRAVLRQASDPEQAAIARAVLRHAPRTRQGGVQLQVRLADVLAVPLARLGRADGEDAVLAACAVLAYLEHLLWSDQQPGDDAVERTVGWLTR
jgi:AcrR family transcriptional regulator